MVEKEKQRLDYIDEMKGIAILLVCLGHLFSIYDQRGTLQPCLAIISSFHMAFFFFLSGYVNSFTNGVADKGVCCYVKKKLRSLIVPHFFWLFLAPFFYITDIQRQWENSLIS